MSEPSYTRLRITGPISVQPVERVESPETTFMIILMGPTGSGKSSFIERLGNMNLGISKDQLEGYTDAVRAYRLVNVVYGHGSSPIVLIDTPGFLDRRLPETKTLKMVRQWIKQNNVDAIHRVIYFHRITDIRMAGTAGRVLKLFRALMGDFTGPNITMVTTMWDTLWNQDQMIRAESRSEELRDLHWKWKWQSFVDEGAVITKYENKHDSAMKTLNDALGAGTRQCFGFDEYLVGELPMNRTTFGHLLYDNLMERKSSITQRLQVICDDLGIEDIDTNSALKAILLREQAEALLDLQVVDRELEHFGPLANSYNRLSITGPISVEPVPTVENVDVTFIILLVGPTGSGKSSFIEHLGDKHEMHITDDTLDGGTREVQAYRLVNLVYGHGSSPIIVIDTPGLLGCNIAETKVLQGIQDWMRKSGVEGIHRIIYFHRITDNRGSRDNLNVIKVFEEMTGSSTGENVTIATTMWNCLLSITQKRLAEERLEQMRKNGFQALIQGGAQILKYENSQDSALSVLNEALRPGTSIPFRMEEAFQRNVPITMASSRMRQLLYPGLVARVFSLEQRMYLRRLQGHSASSYSDSRISDDWSMKAETDIFALKKEIQDLQIDVDYGSFPGTAVASSELVARSTALSFVASTSEQDRRLVSGSTWRPSSDEKPLPPLPVAESRPESTVKTFPDTQRLIKNLDISARRLKELLHRKR
ncbi:hypothetical protein CVT24_010013 [Panaeolus cyanescens]|uniref:AAA+ ATPase domain-containing protein n=1 Tax=Panaeolus cyanescens TaxID=181874 RepID=A0A409VY64_9AGAR|nr:hypothetical protein CVT24_010013 [Panaeolus cyanescens]